MHHRVTRQLKVTNLAIGKMHQRGNYKKGNLSSDGIARLEEIGFKWEIQKDQEEKGFQETGNIAL